MTRSCSVTMRLGLSWVLMISSFPVVTVHSACQSYYLFWFSRSSCPIWRHMCQKRRSNRATLLSCRPWIASVRIQLTSREWLFVARLGLPFCARDDSCSGRFGRGVCSWWGEVGCRLEQSTSERNNLYADAPSMLLSESTADYARCYSPRSWSRH